MYTNFEQFLESQKNTFKKFIKENEFEETYGTYELKDTKTNLEKLKKDLEENYKNDFFKLKIEDKKLIIFKKDVKYNCIMFSSNIDKKKWNNFLKLIDEKDLYLGETQKDIDDDEYGLEKQPHITLLYGLIPKENKKEDVLDWLKSLKSFNLKMENIGIFENDKFDVVKIDIEPTKQLLKYREDSLEKFPNVQSFDGYHPHMTLAYIKSGKGKKYIQKLKDKLELEFNEAIYSDFNYKKEYIKLNDN